MLPPKHNGGGDLEAEAARGKAEKGRKPRKPRRGRNGC
jgi:hypothetical protein